MKDSFEVEILADGTLKLATGQVSPQNHLNAENFLAEVAKELGGKVTIKHKHGKAMHTHTHDAGQNHGQKQH